MRVREKLADLMHQLRVLEFDDNIRNWVKYFIENNIKNFTLPYWKQFGNDTLKYRLHFEKDENLDRYRVQSYGATLKKDLPIPEHVFAGVKTKELASRMEKLNWSTDHESLAEIGFGVETEESRKQGALLPGIMSDLQKLGDVSPMGKELQAAFIYKYWYDTPFQITTPRAEALKAAQEFSTTIYPSFNITASETYTLLNAKGSQTLNHTKMINENLKFLSERVKFAGFGDELKEQLEKKMREGKPEFQLNFSTEMNKKPFEATLNFRKSETTGMYFFNNYHASMERNDGQKVEQTFYLNNGKGITAKEAFNLLDGRAVHKDLVTKAGESYKAWLQLNPEVRDKHGNAKVEQYHEKYGYDLKGVVGQLAIAELKEPEKAEKLMQSFQKGNVQSVTIEKDGSAQSMFVEADPRFKTIKLYDAQMKLVPKEEISRFKAVGEGTTQKTEQKEGADKKKELSEQKKPDKNKSKAENKSLMPKKRENPKRGLKIA